MERVVDKLIRELPKLDPFKGFSEGAVWFAKLIARVKWVDVVKLAKLAIKAGLEKLVWASKNELLGCGRTIYPRRKIEEEAKIFELQVITFEPGCRPLLPQGS